ncbi:chitinase-3-like protein 1 [Halichoeres trimaculatus]|uniref:chitinase-3-like protein 1 n=1 Tax=Halichoeres trimaculatus TaxID=147232 RepID=UPI003D9DC549
MRAAHAAEMSAAGILAALQLLVQLAATAKLVCYFSNMSCYRTGVGRYLPENIDPLLCTHLIYSFAIINHDSELEKSEWNEGSVYRSFTSLKRRNHRLKTLLSLRTDRDRAQFSAMMSSPALRQTFIQSSIKLLRTHGFDGLDLDLADPGSEEGSPEDTQRFRMLCQELSEDFKADSEGHTRLILSAAITAHTHLSDTGNDLSDLSKYLDFLSVRTFDLTEDGVTAHHSPLYSHTNSSVDGVVTAWIQRGVPAEKLLLGFPTHARSFSLSGPAAGIGAPVSGPASPGPYTQQSGVWSHYETCSFLRGSWTQWVQAQKVPFAVKGSEWVGFDNQRSYSAKVDYLRSRGLGGAAVWTLDMDDFSGQFCDQGEYPLISHLRHRLRTDWTTEPTPPTAPPSSSSSSPSTQEPLTSSSSCSLNITVLFPDSRFCSHRADGLYLRSGRPHFAYRCVHRRTYVTKCHSPETQSSSSSSSWTSTASLSLVSSSLLSVFRLWSVS